MYDEIAKGYDELYGEEQKGKLDAIRSHLDSMHIDFSGKHFKILDVGCGTGISTDYFSCSTGVDPSIGMLDVAKNNYSNLNFINAYAEDLPFSDKEFDYVLSVSAVQNFSNLKKGMSEMTRVSKKGLVVSIIKNSSKLFELKEVIEQIVLDKKARLTEIYEKKDIIFVIFF